VHNLWNRQYLKIITFYHLDCALFSLSLQEQTQHFLLSLLSRCFGSTHVLWSQFASQGWVVYLFQNNRCFKCCALQLTYNGEKYHFPSLRSLTYRGINCPYYKVIKINLWVIQRNHLFLLDMWYSTLNF
jgi:hypothetical protein